jgi:hypothetical protein
MVWSVFIDKIENSYYLKPFREMPRTNTLDLFRVNSNPFHWLVGILGNFTGLPYSWMALFLTNLLFLLYLQELYGILCRMTTQEVAVSATTLAAFWPSTIAFHFGSQYMAIVFLVTWCIRAALDNQWLITGVTLAMAMLIDPLCILLLPLFGYFFWYFQRHFQMNMVVKKASLFLGPVLFVFIWKLSLYTHFREILNGSAFSKIMLSDSKESFWAWASAAGIFWQTMTGILLTFGGIAAAVSNSVAIHRVLPVYMLIFFLLFSSYGGLIQRAPLAAVCFQGVTTFTIPILTKVLKAFLIFMGCQQIISYFTI